MKTINLVDFNRSQIKYKKTKFPDGQQDITIHAFEPPECSIYETAVAPITIQARLDNFSDLELIVCATQALKNLGAEEIHLYVPYILGARSDRQFVDGGTSYLKDVLTPILNAQNYKSITCIDAHNPDVTAALIKNIKVRSNFELVAWAFNDILTPEMNPIMDIRFISPDGGSLKKIYKLLDTAKLNNCRVIECSKYRDTDGKLSKTRVPLSLDDVGKTFIIVDDICDGGNTFINIAKEIIDEEAKVYLIVTHGIFSAGFTELEKHFKGIYCTNSYSDIVHPTNFVKQLNVF